VNQSFAFGDGRPTLHAADAAPLRFAARLMPAVMPPVAAFGKETCTDDTRIAGGAQILHVLQHFV